MPLAAKIGMILKLSV